MPDGAGLSISSLKVRSVTLCLYFYPGEGITGLGEHTQSTIESVPGVSFDEGEDSWDSAVFGVSSEKKKGSSSKGAS